MATFAKRGKRWRAQIRKNGISKSATFSTKSEAVAWAKELETTINSDIERYKDVYRLTFAEVIDRYIKEVSLYKKGYREEKLRLFRLLEMPIAKVYLIDLKEQDFAKWRDERLSKVSVNSVLREWATIANIMAMACGEWRLLKENPMKYVRKPKATNPRTRRYSKDEITRLTAESGFLLDAIPETSKSRAGAAMLFAIETAMRAGEICKAKWKHLNRDSAILYLPETKNGHPRNVPLSSKALAIIDCMAKLGTEAEDFIFQLNSGLLEANFRKMKKQAGLEKANLHFHDTRREALTKLAAKVDVMTLAKISGHRDIKILLNTYYAPKMEDVVSLLG